MLVQTTNTPSGGAKGGAKSNSEAGGEDTTEEKPGPPVPLIVGCSVGGLVFILVVVGVCVWQKNKAKKPEGDL